MLDEHEYEIIGKIEDEDCIYNVAVSKNINEDHTENFYKNIANLIYNNKNKATI